MKHQYTWLLVIVAVAAFYLWRYRRAPDLELASIEVSDASGKTESLGSMLADSSIVIFYASWCGPCLRELRGLKNVYAEYEQQGIHFYCVSDDSPDKLEVMRANMPASLKFFHTSSLNDIGIYTIPASYTVLKGQITDKQLSALDWTQKKEILESFNNN